MHSRNRARVIPDAGVMLHRSGWKKRSTMEDNFIAAFGMEWRDSSGKQWDKRGDEFVMKVLESHGMHGRQLKNLRDQQAKDRLAACRRCCTKEAQEEAQEGGGLAGGGGGRGGGSRGGGEGKGGAQRDG